MFCSALLQIKVEMGIVDTNCDCENCRAKRAKAAGSNQSPEEEKKEKEKEGEDVQMCQVIDEKKVEKTEDKAESEEKKE